VPGLEEEALRDLVRAREAVRVDLMRCRHRLSKLLLRHGIRFDDGPAWTQRHRDWLTTIALPWPAAQATMLDAQGAIDTLPGGLRNGLPARRRSGIVIAAASEGLWALAHVPGFRAVFCTRMSWSTKYWIGVAEEGAGSSASIGGAGSLGLEDSHHSPRRRRLA
jgi:transposase